MAELPEITITTPAPNATVETSPLTVSGTASHSNGIATVELRVNGGDWTEADFSFPADWTGEVGLTDGENAIDVLAQ